MGEFKELSLKDFKECLERYLKERKGKEIEINIHITTELDKVKANIQGFQFQDKFDILISGDLKFKLLIEALAHETAHIISQEHDKIWKKEKEEIKKYLKRNFQIEDEEENQKLSNN